MRRFTSRLRQLLGIRPHIVSVDPRAGEETGVPDLAPAATWDEEPISPPPVRIVLPALPGRAAVDLRDFYQTKRTIKTLICHHSAGDPTATVASVRAFHTAAPPKGRGWSDIGYHVILRREGEVWRVEAGRPVTRVGSHDQDQNRDSIGISLFGDYTPPAVVPPAAWELLVEVVAGLVVLYGLEVSDVEGHRENEPPNTPTTCPGYDPADLRAAVAAHLAPRPRA